MTGVPLSLTWGSWWAVPVFMLHGTLINFLDAGQHEMSHGTVFKTRRLNEVFGRFFGFVLLYPPISTRSSISPIIAIPRSGRRMANSSVRPIR